MKKFVLLAAALVVGCNPIPYKNACRMPNFSENATLQVKSRFSTWGYFSERCGTAMPKEFGVSGKTASLNVLIDGEWLRLAAQDGSGNSVQLRGKTLRVNNARIDEQTEGVLELEAVRGEGELERFSLPFRMEECTCVTYDAV